MLPTTVDIKEERETRDSQPVIGNLRALRQQKGHSKEVSME